MLGMSLLKAVQFTLRHTPEDKLKDTLEELLEIYEEILEPERIEYQRAVAQFIQDLEKEKENDEKI